MTPTFTVKKSTALAAYLVATAFVMGGIAGIGPYACPHDHGWRRVSMTLLAGVVWPIPVAASVLGYTAHNTKCADGSSFIDPPR